MKHVDVMAFESLLSGENKQKLYIFLPITSIAKNLRIIERAKLLFLF